MMLSVIVPVYNVERYLVRCVESVVSQELEDYEVILVDDGSTDGSAELCDVLQQRFPGVVKVIHQANGGLSMARNSGIERAQGEYITFLDSDDVLCADTLKGNLHYLIAHPEVDMLEYPVEVHADSTKAYRLTFSDETRTDDVFSDWICRQGYRHCYAWNKIYQTRLWDGIRFPVGAYYEDTAVIPHIVRRCRSIRYSGHGCYRYIMHPGTITTSYSYAKQRQLFDNMYRLYTEIRDDAALRVEALLLWIECLNLLIDLGRCADVDKDDYRLVMAEVDRCHPAYRSVLKAAPRMSTRLKLIPLLLTGLAAYCRIYIAFTKPLTA